MSLTIRSIFIFLLFIFKLFLFSLSLFAQVITYDKSFIFIHDTVDERGDGVTEANGRYFIVSDIIISDIINHDYKIGIAEIDSLGNKVWMKIIGDSVYQYMTGYYNSLNRTSDGFLILTGSVSSYTDSAFLYARSFLMKLTSNGQLLWMKVLNDTMDLTEWTNGTQVIETFDHGFAIIGRGGSNGAVLYKTDSLGDVQWYKTYGQSPLPWYEYLSTIEELPDHGFIMGSYGENVYETQSGDPLVYRLNSSGDIVWKKATGGPHSDDDAFPVLSDDSILMVLSPYTTKVDYYGDPEAIRLQVSMMKLSSGEIIKDTIYGDTDKLYYVTQVRRAKDGTFVACGSDYWGRFGWIFRFKDNGDSLYFRNTFNIPNTTKFDTTCGFQANVLCEDGSILSIGSYYLPYNGEDRGNTWLVKTDRYGCLAMGCDSNAIYILDNPDSSIHCRNQSAEMTISTFSGNRSFQWQVNTGNSWSDLTDTNIYHGIISSTLIMDLSQLNLHNYFYRCKVYNDYYTLFSDSAEVIIRDTLSFLYQPQDKYIRRYDTAIFSILATGQGPITYQWYRNGEPIQDGINNTLIISSVAEPDTGIYFCRVINPCGHENSRFAKLSINTTSIDLLKMNPIIDYYPNPAENYLIINIKTWEKEDISLSIRDLYGRQLYAGMLKKKSEYQQSIDLSRIDPGIYFLEIDIGRQVYLKKIIKSSSISKTQ